MAANGAAPSGATDAVLKPSDPVPDGAMPVKGLDFNEFKDRDITVAEMVENMAQMGFQASSIGQAAKIVDGMVCNWCSLTCQLSELRLVCFCREPGETPRLVTRPRFSWATLVI